MVERLAMHSKGIIPALIGTLVELPSTALSIASNDGLTPFMEAIDFSNLSVVKAMLQLAPELALKRFVDPEDPRLFTYPVIFAAQIAARRESSLAFDIVKLLLSHMPGNYLIKDSDGRTPLHLSVTGYSTSTTKWLLDNHYSPNQPDNNGRTAVHQARSTASLDVLLSAGADINRTDRSGFTCSHLAALQGFEDLVDGLIYRNANLKCVGNIGSPLHCAVLKQSWRIASSLLKAKDMKGKPRVDINAKDANGNTAMHLAVQNSGSTDIVRLLFLHDASANIQNKQGLTPLHLLISSGDFESFKAFMLIEKVVRDFSTSKIIHAALPDAVSKRHLCPTYALKIRHGLFPVIDFDMSTSDGWTPLHIAATFASVDIAHAIQENGANVSIRNMEGNTAVHFAVLATDEDIAKKGGDRYKFLGNCPPEDLAAENKQGIRPWDLALQQKSFDLMTYLLREGGAKACRYETLLTRHDGRKILHNAIDANEWKLVNLLLSSVNRCHLFTREREAVSALLKAIGSGSSISTEDQVKEIFEHWLELFTNETFSQVPIQMQVKALEPGKYSLKQINSLCMVVNAAADYRALGALNTENWFYDAVRHIKNSRFSNRVCTSMISAVPDDLSPFRLEQLITDLEELKPEAFKRLETVLLAAKFPGVLETHNYILRLFRECNLSCLLRLAVLTSVLSPDRPIDEIENCCLTTNSNIIPEILEAISHKDGTVLKERFPIDPNVIIQCCSWQMSYLKATMSHATPR
jgi:ankyrin repeat protein